MQPRVGRTGLGATGSGGAPLIAVVSALCFVGCMGARSLWHLIRAQLMDGMWTGATLLFTIVFALGVGALAPSLAWSLRRSRHSASRMIASVSWALGLPLMTFIPMNFIIGNALGHGVPFIGAILMWTGGAFCAVAYVWIWSRRTAMVAEPSLRRRRLLRVAGIACALLTVPVYVSMGVLYLGTYLEARAALTAPIPLVTFPAGFSGRALITMPVAAAPTAEMVDGTWSFEFPASGRLSFRNRGLGTLRTPLYFERAASGERIPMPSASRDACDAAFADSSRIREAESDGVCWNSVFVDQERWELEFLVLRARDSANATER